MQVGLVAALCCCTGDPFCLGNLKTARLRRAINAAASISARGLTARLSSGGRGRLWGFAAQTSPSSRRVFDYLGWSGAGLEATNVALPPVDLHGDERY